MKSFRLSCKKTWPHAQAHVYCYTNTHVLIMQALRDKFEDHIETDGDYHVFSSNNFYMQFEAYKLLIK